MNTINVITNRIDWHTMESRYDMLLPTLYPARREAVDRLNNQKAKLASMATGLLFQEVVEKHLGIKSDELVVCKSEQGKPYIADCPAFGFNISHSGDVIAIAYGNTSVGIDVEHIRCRENDLKVAKRCFTPEEYAFIAEDAYERDLTGKSHSVEERFFMVWTMKEAYLKYKGTGISVPMNSFVVKPYEGVIVGEKLYCKPVIIDDYVYSVCVNNGVYVAFDNV